eukprot:GHVQ01008680.1.p3 GENE.GHVQ01008680.1~~GHVQ01008680.1.p3  ORF type:complete len:205 (+),score=35.13 GHVQ01008680.1:128-742(+)
MNPDGKQLSLTGTAKGILVHAGDMLTKFLPTSMSSVCRGNFKLTAKAAAVLAVVVVVIFISCRWWIRRKQGKQEKSDLDKLAEEEVENTNEKLESDDTAEKRKELEHKFSCVEEKLESDEQGLSASRETENVNKVTEQGLSASRETDGFQKLASENVNKVTEEEVENTNGGLLTFIDNVRVHLVDTADKITSVITTLIRMCAFS